MAWPSFFLIIAAVGFAVAVAGAIFLQFRDDPPRGIVPAVLACLVLGVGSASVFLMQAQVAEETDQRPSLLAVLFP